MRGFSICMVLTTLALAALSAPAMALPDIHCKLATQVQEAGKLGELPAELRKLLGPIAEAGAPFNKTDAVLDATLPFKRLIRAGHRGTDWFVWYENGGITYFWHAVVVRIPPGGGEAKVLMNAGTISDTLCTLTDGALAGHVPPYPAGTWAQSYF
jgi:hypothetical protein